MRLLRQTTSLRRLRRMMRPGGRRATRSQRMDADSGRHSSKFPRWKVSVAWPADDCFWRKAAVGARSRVYSTQLFPDRIRTSWRSLVSRLGTSCDITTAYRLAGTGNESGLGACEISHQPADLVRLGQGSKGHKR